MKKKIIINKTQVGIFNNLKDKKFILISLIILSFVGFFLRLYNVGYLSVFIDELVHITRAKNYIEEGSSLFANDNVGIFYTFILIPFFKIFGVSDAVARIPNVLMGTASIVLIFFLSQKLFNKYVGLIAAFIHTFSLFLIFYSRVSRNYASFEFFYLIFIIVFLLALESKNINKKQNFFVRNGINIKYLILFFIAFVVVFLNHPLIIFFFFGLGLYSLFMLIKQIIKKEKYRFYNKYSIVAYIFIIFFIFILSPTTIEYLRSFLSLVFNETQLKWFLPDWEFNIKQWNNPELKWEIWEIYTKGLISDFGMFFFVLSFIGLAISFFIKYKSAAFLTGIYLIPLLFLSFFFRTTALPRYAIIIYPVAIISISVALYSVIKYLIPKIISKKHHQSSVLQYSLIFLILIFISFFISHKEIKSIVFDKKNGVVVSRDITKFTFPNWKKASLYLKDKLKKDDIVMATLSGTVNHYLDGKITVSWFRQMHHDWDIKKYVPNKPSGSIANSFDDFVKTFENNDKGWLVADYYFYGPLTDSRARNFVLKNFDYNLEASTPGDIELFSWNKTKKQKPKSFIFAFGPERTQFYPINVKIQPAMNYRVFIDVEGIDHNEEGIIQIGNMQKFFIPKTKGNKRQIVNFEINNVNLSNVKQVAFSYNLERKNKDLLEGFVVYNVMIKAI